MKHYYSLKEYLINEYNEPIYKLSLSCSNTCPNRDGTKGYGGCIFCSTKGSGNFACNSNTPIDEQIEYAKSLVSKKFKGDKYIAYFQAFTSTYGDIIKIKESILEVANRDDIKIISIATRPDCLDDEIIEFFKEINKTKQVWVELGLQTLNEDTAKLINRCYENKEYFDSVNKLHSIGINVITHLIIGLPNENEDDIYKTVKQVSKVTDGIKFTVLHILKNTKLYEMYLNNEYTPLSLDEYVKILGNCIELLDEKIVVHRITGDGDKKELIEPMWSANKKYVLQYIYDYFDKNNIIQGSKKAL